MFLKKIHEELIKIRKELQAIRSSVESYDEDEYKLSDTVELLNAMMENIHHKE